VNLDRCNRFFGDAIRFEGFLGREDGDAVVTSQPMILGRPATQDEIATFFEGLGFARSDQPNAFERLRVGGRDYLIADARPDNVVTQEGTGLVCPIDVHIVIG